MAGGKSVGDVRTYLEGRFEHFMSILEKPLIHGIAEKDYYFEDRLTFADTSVVNMLDAFREAFPKRVYDKYIRNKHKNLELLYQRIRHRANIKRLLDSQEKQNIVWYPDDFYGEMKKNLIALGVELEKEEKEAAEAAAKAQAQEQAEQQKPVAA